MPHLRDVLNKIKWTKDISKAEIWYVHRGAPNNTKVLSGNDILRIGPSFLETSSASIPYHRIFRIVYENTVIYER
jgi:uncharacterized protein (UPF0248 family)